MQGDNRKLVLVNNAGFGFTKPAVEVTEEDWHTAFETHAKGAFFCSQQIGALMLERGYGKIINMSSTWAVATQAGKSVYCSAKAADFAAHRGAVDRMGAARRSRQRACPDHDHD